MPRFYFDLRNGNAFIRDEEGVEVHDYTQAISEAKAVLSQMREDGEFESSGDWTLVIRTEDGATAGTLDID